MIYKLSSMDEHTGRISKARLLALLLGRISQPLRPAVLLHRISRINQRISRRKGLRVGRMRVKLRPQCCISMAGLLALVQSCG